MRNRLLIVMAACLLPVATSAQEAPAAPAPPDVPADVQAAPAAELAPHGYTYSPDGRRDPFVSLVRRGTDTSAPSSGVRGAGLAGLGVSEVVLRGTFQSRGGYLGILQGADNRSYIVRPGDRLIDGMVQAIAGDSLVILQQVNDPFSRETEREVRKVLRQTDEARQ